MQITYLHDQTVDVSSGRAVWNIDMYQSCCNTRLCCKYVTSSNAVTYLHILRYCVDDYVHVLLISLKWKQPFLLQNVTFVAVRIYDGYDSLLCGSLPRRRLRGRLTLWVLRFHFLELWYFASVQFLFSLATHSFIGTSNFQLWLTAESSYFGGDLSAVYYQL